MSYKQLKLENQLCHRLYMASNSIIRAYREPLSQLNLTYPQYLVMLALWETDHVTIAELTQKTSIDSGAMTQILKKMAEKELLLVIKDKDDRRKRFVMLSRSGKEMQEEASQIPEKIKCQFSSISPEQLTTLMSLLDLTINDLR